MLDLLELEQLTAFADCGTLSKAAEKLHISQPTITRTMQHLEETFGVPLFSRTKNHIALNETGKKAVEYARKMLENAEEAVKGVQVFDRSLHTITVSSCAPAPLWSLLPALSDAFPGMTISSSVKSSASVLEDLKKGDCDLAVLTEVTVSQNHCSIPILKENLAVCVPASHEFAGREEVSFSDLNGYNFLLGTRLGFWEDMCREKMPASRFLVQTDQNTLQEVIRESTLPCFVTDLIDFDETVYGERTVVPVSDREAKVTFYAVFDKKEKKYMDCLKTV